MGLPDRTCQDLQVIQKNRFNRHEADGEMSADRLDPPTTTMIA